MESSDGGGEGREEAEDRGIPVVNPGLDRLELRCLPAKERPLLQRSDRSARNLAASSACSSSRILLVCEPSLDAVTFAAGVPAPLPKACPYKFQLSSRARLFIGPALPGNRKICQHATLRLQHLQHGSQALLRRCLRRRLSRCWWTRRTSQGHY